jgi:hypothetical protein
MLRKCERHNLSVDQFLELAIMAYAELKEGATGV